MYKPLNINKKDIVIEAQMLVRRPVEDVFTAFIDPEITRHFWFTSGSSILEKGKTVVWTWEMYGVSAEVEVLDILTNEEISVLWGEPRTHIDFLFRPVSPASTYVQIRNYGFEVLEDEQLISFLTDSTGGFTTVVDGLKVYMEQGINPGLIADKFPAGH